MDLATAENPIARVSNCGYMNATSSCRKWPHADCSDGEADARAAEDGRTLRKNRLPVGGRNGTDSTRAPPGACSSPSVGACGRRARTAVPLGAYSHREGLSVPRSAPRLFDVHLLRPDTARGQTRPSARAVGGLSAGWQRSCVRGCAGAARVRPSPDTHATRGGARVVIHPHGRWARWLGRGALPALCIAIPPCTTAAPAGGAHAGGGVREQPWRLLGRS